MVMVMYAVVVSIPSLTTAEKVSQEAEELAQDQRLVSGEFNHYIVDGLIGAGEATPVKFRTVLGCGFVLPKHGLTETEMGL
jgi:hypothetical protein